MSENCYLFFSENCYCWVKLLFLSEDFKFYTKNIILTIKRKFILTIYKFTHNFGLGWWIFKIQKLTWSSEWDHSKYWCPVKFYSVLRMPTANRVLSAPLGPVRQAEKNVCPAVILLKGLSVLWDFHCVLLYFEWDHSKYLCPVMFYSVQWWGREVEGGGCRESE